jgi:hypothetical protein
MAIDAIDTDAQHGGLFRGEICDRLAEPGHFGGTYKGEVAWIKEQDRQFGVDA